MRKLVLSVSLGVLGAVFIGLFTDKWLVAFGICIPASITAFFSRMKRNE